MTRHLIDTAAAISAGAVLAAASLAIGFAAAPTAVRAEDASHSGSILLQLFEDSRTASDDFGRTKYTQAVRHR